ncbi:MAG: hypothetical protein MZV70_19950 [Desulfobacterales bacterium]|nr:hypothetical protein [Desulfobacterales bacterium]
MPERKIAIQKPALTPFNVVAGIIVVVGLVITVIRFTQGLGATTNLSDYNPWGIWIGFDLLVGVALAAGGYVTSAACYIFGLKRFHSAVRPAILTGFLGYALVVLALHYDVGRPWRLPYPFIVQPGTTSLLFEVAACVALYLTVLFIEFTPAALEWLGLKRARSIVVKLTLVLTIFGVVLSTLHQSSLGRALPDRALEAAPALVLALPGALLLRLQHRRRAVHGDLRGQPGPQALSRQDGCGAPARRRTGWRWASPRPPPGCWRATSS